MKVIAVDDDSLSLEIFEAQLQQISRISEIITFLHPEEALEFAKETPVDVAFLDIGMIEMDGITLAGLLKEANSAIRIVFITSYSEYALKALEMHASGYLIKPASLEDIEQTLDYILLPPPKSTLDEKLKVRCFGNFEVYYDNQPLRFQRSKTKELFAYLVDRQGASINTGELIGILWDSDGDDYCIDVQSQKNQLRVLISDLSRTLRSINCEEVFRKRRGSFSIDPTAIDCDYYSFLEREPAAMDAYFGEYMTQYSWAEMTLAALEQVELRAGG